SSRRGVPASAVVALAGGKSSTAGDERKLSHGGRRRQFAGGAGSGSVCAPFCQRWNTLPSGSTKGLSLKHWDDYAIRHSLDSRNEHRFRDRGLVLHFQDRQDGGNGPEELREKQIHPGVPIFQLRAQRFVPDLYSLCRNLYLG